MSAPSHADLPVTIAGHQWTLRKGGDLDRLMDELIARGEGDEAFLDERLPYWAELWPASIAMAEWLLEDQPIPSGSTALELGCGPGLAGVAAGAAGVETIVTDIESTALDMARHNWKTNLQREPEVLRLDWREPPSTLQVPYLIAADVAYEERFFGPLVSCAEQLLAPGGIWLLTEPGRPVARTFFSRLINRGWKVDTHHRTVSTGDSPATRVNCCVIQRKG